MPAFVKFSRGLTSAFERLAIKDPNTLYLIYDSENATRGSLYLGNKLISSVSGSATATSLGELSDVSLGTLSDGMILQYNSSTGGGIWQAVPISSVLPGGINNNISFEESLEDIENPNEKDIVIINEEAYIYNGEDWIKLTDSDLADRITALETSVGSPSDPVNDTPATGLYADIEELQDALDNVYTKEEIAEQIAQAQHLRYEKVGSLATIDTDAAEASHTIYLVPSNNSDEDDLYDEYFVVDNSLEKIGTWGVNLNDLLTQEQKDKLDAITLDQNDNLVITSSQVSDLNQVLADSQYIKRVQAGVFEVTEDTNELRLIGIPSNLLNDYVTNITFNNTVGDLSQLTNRVSNNSTLVEEINSIKESLIWNPIPIQE